MWAKFTNAFFLLITLTHSTDWVVARTGAAGRAGALSCYYVYKELFMAKNNRTQTNKNRPPLQTSAWVASLIIQLVALLFIGIVALSFEVVGISIVALLAVGFTLLVIRTVRLIKGRLTDEDSISTLTAIHLVAFIISILVIGIFLAFFYGTRF
jgi:hypothetical protein